MKTILISLFLILFSIASSAQNQTKQNDMAAAPKETATNKIYQLFPTKNYWTFIKLDTRNGKLWQVHFTVKDDGGRDELSLNLISLVGKEKGTAGRFTIYPTENMYNFYYSTRLRVKSIKCNGQWRKKTEVLFQLRKR